MEQVFRPLPVLGVAMAVAAAFWLAVLVFLLQAPSLQVGAAFKASLFALMFVASVAYYSRTAIVVDRTGVSYRGLTRTLHFTFDDIQRLKVVPGLVTLYVVDAGHRAMYFSSFFGRHRELLGLLKERARLE